MGGAKPPALNDAVVVFASPKRNQKVISSCAYTAAGLMVDLGAMMASADGEVHESEWSLLARTIDSWDGLDDHCRARLRAHLQLQVTQPSATAAVKKKLDMLTGEARRTVADILVCVAKADNVISASEVRTLEKMYKLLQIDPKLVYSDLHNETDQHSRNQLTGFALNSDRIAKLQAETERISVVLKDVFADEQAPETSSAAVDIVENDQQEDAFLGLDQEHAGFARLLISRPLWSRADLSDAASDLDLMLDGALEKINEAVLEKFDMPITEGDDPVEINGEAVERIFA